MKSALFGTCLVSLILCWPSFVINICDPDIPSRPMPTPPAKSRLRSRSSSHQCGAGEYPDNSTGSCKQCPHGHFMTELMSSMGNYETCETCLQANPDEVIIQNCTPTMDSTILCNKYKYRTKVSDNPGDRCYWECESCSVCGVGTYQFLDFETEPCGNFSDTVCCFKEGMKVLHGRCVDAATTVKSPDSTVSPHSSEERQTKGGEAMSTKTSLGLGAKNSVCQKLMFLLPLFATVL